MTQPNELKINEPLLWSTGKGTDVWDLFCACMRGDLPAVQRLVSSDPSLVRTHYRYRKPLYFAVRENQLEVVAFLLERDPDPIGLAVNDSLLDIARDRGCVEMQQLLESKLGERHGASTKGEPVAAAIRANDLTQVRRLLNTAPDLLEA